METKAINTKLKGHARVDVADVLRGLAVMGIIILHSIAKVLSLLFFEAIEIFFYIDFSTFANKMTM